MGFQASRIAQVLEPKFLHTQGQVFDVQSAAKVGANLDEEQPYTYWRLGCQRHPLSC